MLISCVSQDSSLTSWTQSEFQCALTVATGYLWPVLGMDSVLLQLICHDMFLCCTTSQIPPVVRSNLRAGKVWDMAPSVELSLFIYLFACNYIVTGTYCKWFSSWLMRSLAVRLNHSTPKMICLPFACLWRCITQIKLFPKQYMFNHIFAMHFTI